MNETNDCEEDLRAFLALVQAALAQLEQDKLSIFNQRRG